MNLPFSNKILYPEQKIIHQRGNVYCVNGNLLLLALVDFGKTTLICLDNYANRWSNPISTKDYFNVSSQEFKELIDPFNDEVIWEYIGQIEDFLRIKNDTTTTKKKKNPI